MSGHSFDSIMVYSGKGARFEPSSPSPDRQFYHTEYNDPTKLVNSQRRQARKLSKSQKVARTTSGVLGTSRSLRRTKGAIVLVEGSGLVRVSSLFFFTPCGA